MSFGSSKQRSQPVDMTPGAFKNLQQPFANVFAALLGAGQPGSPFGGVAPTVQQPQQQQQPSGWGPIYSDAQGEGPTFQGYGPMTEKQQAQRTMQGLGFKPGNQIEQQPQTTTPAPYSGDPQDILSGIPTYQGELTAELGQNEQAILDQLMGLANGSTQPGQTGSAATDYLTGLLGSESPYSPQYTGPDQTTAEFIGEQRGALGGENPFLQASIDAATRPILQNLEETLTRSLPGRFTQAGQFVQPQGSSAFDRAAAIASRGATQEIGDIASDLSFRTFEAQRGREAEMLAQELERRGQFGEAERTRQAAAIESQANRQLEAAKSLPQITAQETQTLVENLQAQALPRLIEEMGIERGLEQFNTRMNNLLTTLGIGAGVTRPVVSQDSSGKSTSIGLK